MNLQVGRNIDISVATSTDTHYLLESSLLACGGIGFTIGNAVKQARNRRENHHPESVRTARAASRTRQVINCILVAGKDLLTGDSVTINPGYDQPTHAQRNVPAETT